MPADFIEMYDGALDRATCQGWIQRFDASGQAQRGQTGSGVDVTMKDSWDIQLDRTPGWNDVSLGLNGAVLAFFKQYLRRYAHVALAPLQLKMQDPASGQLVLLDAGGVARLPDELLTGLVAKVFRFGSINIQKYVANQGGYPYWHCEQYPKLDQGEALHRALLWTIYLNDGFDGGETEFLYQERKVRPRTGSLLIAPAGFTHTHRGNRPTGGDKYIATSWILYQRAETLFGG
ncbi:2OG-Fe(II) oxygenase [Massilia yuzhufengensis]|uniref:2OG-Fe(II) oxygenase superfamily protein n=1 Tax=Massilia yuzhufengensis TaxID=1164594 RepID=A0A1I1PLS2_9BURK|nr:2OG-Fe(II) oxygenase [Massilia yuzhufengensis]SFD06950.1 2OG-Fe(II) oxygenase superfamily protein [Massilia yuzhufengensis]